MNGLAVLVYLGVGFAVGLVVGVFCTAAAVTGNVMLRTMWQDYRKTVEARQGVRESRAALQDIERRRIAAVSRAEFVVNSLENALNTAPPARRKDSGDLRRIAMTVAELIKELVDLKRPDATVYCPINYANGDQEITSVWDASTRPEDGRGVYLAGDN